MFYIPMQSHCWLNHLLTKEIYSPLNGLQEEISEKEMWMEADVKDITDLQA